MAKKMGADRQLPSQHEKERAQREIEDLARATEARRQETRRLAAFDWMLKQENGRVVWAWLFDRCGYNKPVLMRMAGGDIAPLSTEAAAAQREVYRDMRRLVSPELLAQAEYEAEFGVKQTDKKGEKK